MIVRCVTNPSRKQFIVRAMSAPGKKGKSKLDKLKKLPKTLNFLFHKDGLRDKNIPKQKGGVVYIEDIYEHEDYAHYTEADFEESIPTLSSHGDGIGFVLRRHALTGKLYVMPAEWDTKGHETHNGIAEAKKAGAIKTPLPDIVAKQEKKKLPEPLSVGNHIEEDTSIDDEDSSHGQGIKRKKNKKSKKSESESQPLPVTEIAAEEEECKHLDTSEESAQGLDEPKQKNGKKKKDDPNKKLPKIFNYLFYKDGLSEKGIQLEEDGSVYIHTILQQYYPDYEEDEVHLALKESELFEIKECPFSERLKIKATQEASQSVSNDTDWQEWSGPPDESQAAKQYRRPVERQKSRQELDKLSRSLWWLLARNGAIEKGLTFQPGDWLDISEIFYLEQFYRFSEDDVRTVVQEDPRGSFELSNNPDNRALRIRAVRNKSRGGQDAKSPRGPKGIPQHFLREEDPDVRLSKTLSFILRHGAERCGFKLQPGGFLFVEEILSMPQLADFHVGDVERVVHSNDKQRFYMETCPTTGHKRIRANQGHTIQIEGMSEYLTPINNPAEYPYVVHGTYKKNWEFIKKQGLHRMQRNHIHFAQGEPGDAGVISGMRSSCDIMIFIDLPKAISEGLKFSRSVNNVILSAGDELGFVRPQYFKEVIQRKPRVKLQF